MADRLTSERVIAAVLFGLVGLTAALVFQVRSIERSHRATADNALRDYAALAAWQYSERIQSDLLATANSALLPVHDFIHVADAPELRRLPPPDVLLGTRHDGCQLAVEARFAFRIDVERGTALFAGGTPNQAVRDSLLTRLLRRARIDPADREVRRLMIATLGGETRAIAYGFAKRNGAVHAVYGIESKADAVVPLLQQAFKHKELLPPTLLRGRSISSVLALAVRAPGTRELASFGDATDSQLSASTTTNEASGELTTQVVLRPEAASALLIGGAPISRLPLLLAFLAGSVLLAGIALVQIRRGRELARLRTRFVANVSHELRTPLAQISMFSETLLLGRERSRAEAREFLSVIFREARRLSQLVESVLSFSRTEAAPRLPTKLVPLDVSHQVGEALHAFTPIAAAAGMTLSAHLDGNAIAAANSNALRQVLINLLDNAVKFGAAGQTITVTVRRADEEIVLLVDDEGPGVPVGERRLVFEPFTQGAAAESSDHGQTGAGIGLTVVAELVRAMGGRVWIEDGQSGRGARVACALRAERATVSVPALPVRVAAAREPAIAR